MITQAEFKQILADQDELVSPTGAEIWVGMEPTFTRRFSESAEWLSEALGAEKLAYAYAVLNQVRRCQPGGVVLHTLGRQYGGEDSPRWSIGYYQTRNSRCVWEGPMYPGIETAAESKPSERPSEKPSNKSSKNSSRTSASANGPSGVEVFWQALIRSLKESLWPSAGFIVDDALSHRILFHSGGDIPVVDVNGNPGLARASVHAQKIPLNGISDELARQGDFLLCMGMRTITVASHQTNCLVVELPEMASVDRFVQLIHCIAQVAKQTGNENLYLQGFPPPVDNSVAWTTITPDPAVIEINQAPASNAVNFYELCRLHYGAAETAGLHSYRLHYNGVVSDSGGGGQFTLGGPSALNSPFFRFPHILPRLVRYVTKHPALSYWFAPPSIGGSSQSPRCDEGVGESFNELALALEQLESCSHPGPEFIWRSLSPFLVDPSGNPHRSELNIEKLWNSYLPGRGCLGLVEFRAFRMSRSAECAAAIAVLLRNVVIMLIGQDKASRLVVHDGRLHDKFALPFFLREDLRQVFKDLETAGLPMHQTLKTILMQEPVRTIGQAEFHGCRIDLEQALEFWPLIGDVASQEAGGSRLVDASTTRLQLSVRPLTPSSGPLQGWEVSVDGFRVPLHTERDSMGPVKIIGLRYRNFTPTIGLHPGIAARNRITLLLTHHDLKEALEITYYEWHPRGIAYPGLPTDLNDAARRRAQRLETRVVTVKDHDSAQAPPESAVTEYCLDLRRLPV